KVNATDAAGLTGSATASETVNPQGVPVVVVNAPTPNPANESQTVSVTWTVTSSATVTASCINWGDGSSACGLVGVTASSQVFTISVNATDAAGKTGSATASVTINDLTPVVTITSVSPNPATSGQTVSVAFTATDDEAISKTCISWGDGVSACGIVSPVTHVYTVTASTIFTITVNATDAAGKTGSATAMETVNPPGAPVVTVTAPSPNTANEGHTLTVTC